MNVAYKKNINLLIIIMIGLIFSLITTSIYKYFTRFEVSEGVNPIKTEQIKTGSITSKTTTGTILNKQPAILSGTKDRESKVTTKEGTKPVLGNVSAGYEPIGGLLFHKGFYDYDYRQDIVRYAYEKGGMDLVLVMECESGTNPVNVGDNGDAFGLCQMNNNYHKIPAEYYKDWKFQVDYCSEKRKQGTPFYGPDRYIKGVKCSQYVQNRFEFR